MRKKVRVRTKLFIIVLTAVLPTVVIALFSAHSYRNSFLREKTITLSDLCETFLNEQRLILDNGREMLLAVSQSDVVQESRNERLSVYLRALMLTYQDYSTLLAADSTGLVISSGVDVTGYTLADREYFSRAMANKAFTVGQFITSKSTGLPSLPFALPVWTRSGSFVVLVAAFDLRKYYQDFSVNRMPSNGFLEIFDATGHTLFTSSYRTISPVKFGEDVDSRLLSYAVGNHDSLARRIALRDGEYLVAAGAVGDAKSPIYVSVRLPWAEVRDSANAPAIALLCAMLVALALASFLSLSLARVLLVRRIETLTKRTKMLAEGMYDVRIAPGRTRDEIADLVDSFNFLANIAEERSFANRRTIHEQDQTLRELRQRIMDNLQLLSSMINLQIEHSSDETVRRSLMTTHSRVMALSLVYETLFSYSDFRLVDLQRYGTGLCDFLVAQYADVGLSISCLVTGDDVFLPIEKALPLALILNELVSNSVLHAFTNRRKGEIRIVFERVGDTEIFIGLFDDGVGFEGDIHQNDTLGFEMIEALVEQIRGSFAVDSNVEGTCVSVKLPVD